MRRAQSSAKMPQTQANPKQLAWSIALPSHDRYIIGRRLRLRTLQYLLLPAITELLGIYLEEFRTLLAERSSPWLFPNQSGGHKLPSSLAEQIPRIIEGVTGLPLNLHLFRHFCAFRFLKQHPGEYETVRQMLKHQVDQDHHQILLRA